MKKPKKAHRKGTRKPRENGPIVRVAVPSEKAWELKQEEVEIVKKAICPGATDEELQYCLAVARRNKLDPFRRQIHFVPRGRGQDKKWVPIVGIDGLRHIAARDHRDYGSIGEAEYGPKITVKWTYWVNGKPQDEKTIQVPEWARVEAFKKGCAVPTVGKVYWEEIYANIDNAPTVRQMPRLMLGKCAEAQAVRKAYPSTDGLYTPEEFAAMRPDYTSSGRLIEYGDEPTYSRKLDENARTGHPAGSEKAKQAEAQLAKVEKADQEFAAGSNTTPGSARPNASNVPQSGKVGEAAASSAPTAPKPTGNQAQEASGQRSAPPPSKPPKETATPLSKPPQARIPHKIIEAKRTSGNKGVEIVLDTGHRMFCFRNSKADDKGTMIFDLLMAGVGKMIIAQTHLDKNYYHVDRVLQLGDREWDEEGIPVLRRDPPGPLLKDADEYKGREF